MKKMIAVNEQSPGPIIEANMGDTIVVSLSYNVFFEYFRDSPQVNVINNLSNATAIHWHGQFQRGTPFYDGKSKLVVHLPYSNQVIRYIWYYSKFYYLHYAVRLT